MATAAITTCGREARPHRGRALPRRVWQLLVLAGLAWCGLLLLGGTAHADACDASSCPPERATQPLLGEVGTAVAPALPVGELTAGLPTVAAVTDPVLTTVTDVLRIPAAATPPVAAAAVPAVPVPATPVLAVSLPAPLAQATPGIVEDMTGDIAEVVDTQAASANQAVAAVVLPSLTDTVVPAVSDLTTQVEVTVAQVEELISPVPLAGLPTLHDAVSSVTELATGVLSFTTLTADTVVAVATTSTAPALALLTGPVGSVVVTTAGAFAAASAGDLPTHGASVTAAAPGATPVGAETSTASEVRSGQVIGGPATPPPDGMSAAGSSSMQSAPAAVTTLAVPASGAGSIATGGAPATGSGSSCPAETLPATYLAGRADTLLLAPVEGPESPMPGTPLDDPGFSPD